MAFEWKVIGCANPECRKLTIWIVTGQDNAPSGSWRVDRDHVLYEGRIYPSASYILQPDYVPVQIREDYYEACLIRDLSPKASATLSRRCLQGMIRDFCKVSGKTLYQEIDQLSKAVEAGTAPRDVSVDSISAIQAVREIGNIGAHMEADVEHILTIDPGEAQMLIDLIETLLKDWYVERYVRTRRFARLTELAEAKKAEKLTSSS